MVFRSYFSAVARVTASTSESCASEGVSMFTPSGSASASSAATSFGDVPVASLSR